jgi:glucose/arabinose dehydrogenase/PKD repeat protein
VGGHVGVLSGSPSDRARSLDPSGASVYARSVSCAPSREAVLLRHRKTSLWLVLWALLLVLAGASGPGAAAPAGLVAAYGFNETSGSAVSDASGNGNIGTISNATRTTAGKFGSALSFNATPKNNVVAVPHSASLALTSGMTLEAWVRPATLGTTSKSWRTVLFKERTGGMTYALYANNGGARPVGQVFNNAQRTSVGPAQLPLNTWTHLATTYDGAALKLFVNGGQVASLATTGSITASTGALKIGGNAIWGEWFDGLIDEVRIYNRALAESEIQSDMNAPVTVDTAAPSAPTNLRVVGSTENSVSLAWDASTDDVGVARYDLYRNSSPAGSATGTTATVGSLTCGTSHDFAVEAVDSSGNRSPQATLTASTDACDTTPPQVAITAPTAGSTVGGITTIQASASDNKSVAGVRFKVNGADVGSEDTSAPYAADWDTTKVSNGPYSLTAIARDGSGNETTSTTVSARVFNQVPSFTVDTLVTGLNEPTELVFTPGGRLWIAERTGKIKILQPGATAVDTTPLIDLPNIYAATDERGVLGLTLDPDFATNGFFYVHYTHSTLFNRVSRFTAVGNTADPASEVVLWQNDQQSAIYHSGGTITFGPDGYLYIAVGDRLDPQSSQRLDAFSGKILRIARDGSVPTDNPFHDGAGPNKDAIWVYGLRNPFRFSFDPSGGRMYIGDVGQNTTEEVDVGIRGANYGWPTCEGPCGRTGLTDPIHSYSHSVGDAVIGGFVYRATQFPPEYRGSYIYADYVEGWFKRLTFDGTGAVTGNVDFLPLPGSTGSLGNPVSLLPAPDGSIYYLDIGPFQRPNTGTLRRIRNTTSNQPPVIVADATPRTGSAPLTVSFSSEGSHDPEGLAVTYQWDFGDGTSSTAANPSHTYSNEGHYAATLTLSDGNSTAVSPTLDISVGNAPVPLITSPAVGSTFRAGDTLSFSGTATDEEDGALPPTALEWKVTFLHETHQHPGSGTIVGANGTYPVPSSGHAFTGNTRYEITLTATDSTGLQSSTSIVVYPEKVNLTLGASPSGATVVLDGLTYPTPYTFDTAVGFHHAVDVVSPQALSGVRYRFGSWSDGGAKEHELVVGPADATYTATLEIDPTNPGLVGAYSFDEANGGTLYDLSGSGNDGTVSGAAWTGSGKHGGGLLFDGVNDVVTVADANALDFTNAFTLEAWVYPTAFGSNWRTVIFKERPGGMLYSIYAFNKRINLPMAQAHLNGAEQNANGSAALPLNAWSHLASTYDGSTLRFYVNGIQVGTKAVTGSLVNTANPLRIGGNSIWNEYFQGQIDDVRLYNRVLSADEIGTDMSTAVG